MASTTRRTRTTAQPAADKPDNVTDLTAKLAASVDQAGQTAGGRSATGDNGGGHRTAEKQAAAKPDAQPEVKPDEPKAEIELTVEMRPYYRPTVTLASGTKVQCGHPYGHEHTDGGRKSAMACGSKIARTGAFVK